MKHTRYIFQIIALAVALIAAAPAALAASSFTVINTSGTSKFVITRTTNTSTTETVYYRTVSLSAIAGKHFTEKTGYLTFNANNNSYEVEVSETSNSNVDEQYHFQTGTTRSYRFEVLDPGGFRLGYAERSITYGTTYQHSASYVNKSITDLVYFNNGSLASGSGNKYRDVAHDGTSGTYKKIDDGYDYNNNTLCTVSTSSLYNNSDALRTYLKRDYNNYKMYATVYFTMYEEDDGYQYIQILTDNSTTYDGKDGDGEIDNGPDISVYKAAFILTKSENHCTDDHYQAFPHRYDYKNRTEGNQSASHTEFEYADSYLYQQAFKSSSYRASNSGSLILATTVNNINVRFDANGSGDDTWYVKNLKVRLALVDAKAPTVLSYSVAPGTHAKGNAVYVTVAFSEIVTCSSAKLTSNWGDFSYVAGSGSNVLTFTRTIPADASSSLNITGYSGIADLAGNTPSSVSATGICAVDASADYSITYDLAGGTLATDNPDSYTWETETFTLNNPARLGYWFDGWTGSNGNSPSKTVTITNHSHGDRTYTANWTKVWTGSGTQGDPYVITTTKGLDLLAMYVNGLNGNTAHDCDGVYFQLGADITYTHTTNWDNASSTENNYTAIGTNSNEFQGTFDGQDHIISGIRIYRGGGHPSADSYQGLFGSTKGGTVRGVNLADARITGIYNVGGIAGKTFQSTVEDCTIAADVCIHAVLINSESHGGIVGFNQGTVRRCHSRATLSAANATGCNEFGAIAGNAQGNIYDCIVVGAIVPDVSKAGALFGYRQGSTFRRNYYFSCTVAGVENATGVGVGSDDGNTSPHDLTANQGAQALYSITLPDGVTLVRSASATLPGTGNATYTTGADIDGAPYAYDGATLRLSYTGEAPAEGYNIALYVNGVQATDNGDGTFTATMPAADAEVTIGSVVIPWAGNGTPDDPWQIQYPSQLKLLAANVNIGNQYADNYFLQTADLVFDGSEDNYNSVGDAEHSFLGKYNGNGKIISGININNITTNVGLFGWLGNGGVVDNICLKNSTVTGRERVGGIVGWNRGGSVTNCRVESDVTVKGNRASSLFIGGIVGHFDGGAIDSCFSAATIGLSSSSGNNYGGIVGCLLSGSLSNCQVFGAAIHASSAAGAVVGKLNNGSLSQNYYNACTVNENTTNVGCGDPSGDKTANDGAVQVFTITLGSGITATASATLTYDSTAYYTAGTTVTLSHGSAPAGYQEPFLGYSLNGTPFNGNSFEMPAADATVTARWTVKDFESGHDGTEADPYIIYNKEQLDQLASRVNSGTSYSDKFIKLGADIEYDSTENYTSIGNNDNKFRGTFDGDGHTVSGIVLTEDSDYRGLFGYLNSQGTVKNVTLSNSAISGKSNVGGIVGYNDGTVVSCIVKNSVTISTTSQDSNYHGGITGFNYGTIQGCVSSATVENNGKNRCRSYGSIAGSSSKTIENCLVIGSNVVSGTVAVGAIVSNNSRGYLRHNYYYDCSVGGVSSNVGCYQDEQGTIIRNGDITINDGAVQAVASVSKPAEIGAQIASYSGGLTVYEHGAYYKGTYYLRHDLAGTAEALGLVQGTKDGVSAWWGTFYDSSTNYELSEGAAAYTMDKDFHLYRLGTNGRKIPKGTAVVIVASSADAALIPAGTGTMSATDHAPDGNILVGNDAATSYSSIYVLSVDSGEMGFRKLSTGTLPAHKAGYEPKAGMQDYDKQDNQEW